MSCPNLSGNALTGLGAYQPSLVLTNDEICQGIDTDSAWIVERSGILERRWADDKETLAVMGEAAARDAITDSGIAPERIDCVITTTSTYLNQFPALGPEIAARLELRNPAAFDLNAACSGFTHAVGMADSLISAGAAHHVLVVSTERLSDVTDPTDRKVAFLSGDGAGAVVVAPSGTGGIGPMIWGSDGERRDYLQQGASWPSARSSAVPQRLSWNMMGPALFKWVAKNLPPVIEQALEAAGVRFHQIDAFVPHQANLRIIEALTARLPFREDLVVATTITELGNSSSASIPLALSWLRDREQLRSGQFVLLAGFGAGLSYAVQVVQIP
ncbi:beta-ketoacyl-ACP synthase III [Actinomadura sp. WAC 06369]|uniref:beta-ketoacyl-ACP synthase III n=1 Tax=Actinomadura sp. WAC 06369 TaxID=2203193 RepID=UPI000F78F314|nr:beta-ketoacyl-ACP synthase III [Actinomadura sp. WAC 06369]RSN66647.1 3-oxoacyl-ACP synthase [Actinomadura sp. WAC 06369]